MLFWDPNGGLALDRPSCPGGKTAFSTSGTERTAWWPMHTSTTTPSARPHLCAPDRPYASEYPSNMHAALWGREWAHVSVRNTNRMAHHYAPASHQSWSLNSVLLRYRVCSSCVHAGGATSIRAASRGNSCSHSPSTCSCGPKCPLQQRPSGAGDVDRPSVEVEMV
jgi:hypothetical protein